MSTMKRPPLSLPQLAKDLGATGDQLLGIEKVKETVKRRDSRLWRRFSLVEKLPPQKKKQIVQILDAFLETERLRKIQA